MSKSFRSASHLALAVAGAYVLGLCPACSEETPAAIVSTPDAPDGSTASGGLGGAANGSASGDGGSGAHGGGDGGGGTSSQDGGGGASGRATDSGASGNPSQDAGDGIDASPADGGERDAGNSDFTDIVANGTAESSTTPRPSFGAILVANDGARSYVVESRRDVEQGPIVGIPWRARFRVAAYDAERLAWTFDAAPDDQIGDVIVHPSGDVTLSLQRYSGDRQTYDLVRLTRDGTKAGVTTLKEPSTIPSGDFGPSDPRPLFRMKADLADATTAGWVRLLADGENVVAAFLTYVDVPSGMSFLNKFALGLATYDLKEGAYVERWARVVEGAHSAQPAAWAYDEFRWREQAIRPFLARDDVSGDLLVGRAWNDSRCRANVKTFAEFTNADCLLDSVGSSEFERLPLAMTRFDASGARVGTRVLAIDEDAAEQVPFGLLAHDGRLVVAGSVVRLLANGNKRTYPDENGYVDYDGYIALYDREGKPVLHRDFNLGRGDVLAGLRLTPSGVVAVGASGWDRWQGGMSISRGADPLFASLSFDGASAAQRVVAFDDDARHFNLHDVVVEGGKLVGYGFSDAPMTHSADGDNAPAGTFGALRVTLSAR